MVQKKIKIIKNEKTIGGTGSLFDAPVPAALYLYNTYYIQLQKGIDGLGAENACPTLFDTTHHDMAPFRCFSNRVAMSENPVYKETTSNK